MFQTRRAEHMAYIVCWGYGWNLQLDGGYSTWCAQVSSPNRWEQDDKCLAHWQVNKSQWCLAQDDKSQTCQKCLEQINRSPWCLAQDDKHQVSAWHINVSAAWHRSHKCQCCLAQNDMSLVSNAWHRSVGVSGAWHRSASVSSAWHRMMNFSHVGCAWHRLRNVRSAWHMMMNFRHIGCALRLGTGQEMSVVLGIGWSISDMLIVLGTV